MSGVIFNINDIQSVVEPVAQKYRLKNVWLFGSYARGTAKPDSDIDLLIEADEGTTLFQLGGVYSEISDALGKNVDIALCGNLSDEFLFNIADDEVRIYG